MDKKEIAILEKLGYRTLSKLGYGGYGIVFLVEKNGAERVVKIAKGKFSKEVNLSEIREAIFLRQLASPYIVGIGAVSVSQDDSYIVIELERMDMAFSEIEKTKQTIDYYRKLIYSVVNALKHMHTKGFVHNDIKPQNILIKKDTFKLADFGLCNYMGLPIPSGLVSFCSTDYYKAPNSVGDRIYVANNRYNYNSDIYSLGALMYWMVVKIPAKKKQAAAIDLTAAEYLSNRDLFIDYYGAEGVDFMERCLDRNTATRMSSKTALEHPYLKKYKAAGGSTFTKFVKEKYSEDDMYAVEYIEDFYKNYKDVNLQFHKIKDSAGYLAEIEKMLQFSLTNNKSMESFVQYMILFRKTIRDFPQKKLEDLSLCCFSMMSKVYEDTACNVMLRRLLREIPNKTPEDTLVSLELEILNHYGFNVPLIPIHSMIFYYFLKNKKTDINVSFQQAIRLLLSTRIDGECTLDELVKFAIKPNKGNKLESLKKDGMTNNIGLIDAIDLEPEDDEVEVEDDEVEVDDEVDDELEVDEEEDDGLEVEICEIDGKKYLKDESGTIYDAQTQEMLGKYDFQKKKWIGSMSSSVKAEVSEEVLPLPASLHLSQQMVEDLNGNSSNVKSTNSTSSNLEVDECIIDGITYFKDEEGNVYDSETEEMVGKFNFSKKVWINYKESMNSIYENAMRLYTQGDRVNMVRYLQHHIELFSDKKYLNLRRVILEKAQDL